MIELSARALHRQHVLLRRRCAALRHTLREDPIPHRVYVRMRRGSLSSWQILRKELQVFLDQLAGIQYSHPTNTTNVHTHKIFAIQVLKNLQCTFQK
jgi:hypothetical protein